MNAANIGENDAATADPPSRHSSLTNIAEDCIVSTPVELLSPLDYTKETVVPIKQPMMMPSLPNLNRPPGRRRSNTEQGRRCSSRSIKDFPSPGQLSEDNNLSSSSFDVDVLHSHQHLGESYASLSSATFVHRRSPSGGQQQYGNSSLLSTPRSVHSAMSYYTEMTYHSDTELHSSDGDEESSFAGSLYLPDAGILFQKNNNGSSSTNINIRSRHSMNSRSRDWSDEDIENDDDDDNDDDNDDDDDSGINRLSSRLHSNNLSVQTLDSFFSLSYPEETSTVSSLSMGDNQNHTRKTLDGYDDDGTIDSSANTDGAEEVGRLDRSGRSNDSKIEIVFSLRPEHSRRRCSTRKQQQQHHHHGEDLKDLLEEEVTIHEEEGVTADDVELLSLDEEDVEEEYIEEVLLNDIVDNNEQDTEDYSEYEVVEETSVEEEIEEFISDDDEQ